MKARLEPRTPVYGLDAEIVAPSGIVIARGPVPLTVVDAPEEGVYAYRYFDDGNEIASARSSRVQIGDHLTVVEPTFDIV